MQINHFSPVLRSSILRTIFVLTILLTSIGISFSAIPNVWHIPDNSIVSGNGGTTPTMRNPRFEFGNTGTVRVFTGLQKFGNNFGTADQNGGSVLYKTASQSSWTTAALFFHQDQSPNNQYWYADLNVSTLPANEVIQYYFQITFNHPGPADDVYLYGGGDGGGSQVSTNQALATATPYTVRNRAAFVFHASNRVLAGGNVQFWAKTGYIAKDNDLAKRWVTNGALYYTTNGTDPAGSFGVAGNGATTAVAMNLDHLDGDPSPAGNAMWWRGDTVNLPTFTTIKYKIGFWTPGTNEEKFADYNAPTDNRDGHIFSFSIGIVGDPSLTVNGTEANYTTTHTYINEVTGSSTNFALHFSPNDPLANPSTVQIFTNLNRRDFATLPYTDVNGVWTEEGINPPSGDLVSTNDAHYYKAYAMTGSLAAGFDATINASKTGAYRLTARYQRTGETTWRYYNSNGRRDHAIVVSPETAHNMSMYELNAMTVESQGTQSSQRSTFTDLHDGTNSRAYNSVTARFNLDYIKNLGANWLWFQPIHPAGIEGRQTDPVTGQIFETGSPYAVKNFFAVSPLLAKSYTPSAIYNPNDPQEDSGRGAAMLEFQNFVSAADSNGINVMLDAPFNHTSYDGELSGSGVAYFSPGSNPRDLLRQTETRVYSRNGDYAQRATLVSGQGPAVAPDRGDFGKFGDVYDIFFGRYSALVAQNPQDNGNYLNESDNFFYQDANWISKDRNILLDGQNRDVNITQNVWKYFSDYILFWLDRTGCPANTSVAEQAYKGIDGLRADFGQGLPPQCWEYMINKARSRKWSFVFMAESLDGGAVTYRSGRHFDVLNENIVFPFQAASKASDYRNIFENRRNAYGQAMVLMNNTSHDEENYTDPYEALIRYSTTGAIDGVPMIFMGQEMGISRTFGFDTYETNFGKQIAHFKKYNSLQPILAPVNRTYALDQLYPVYSAIGAARQFSPALRSSNRYFLSKTSGGDDDKIFAVAKYQAANASPVATDVVFAFANLERNSDHAASYNVNTNPGGTNLFGIKTGRSYNLKNISAYTGVHSNRRDIWQWRVPPYDESAAPEPRSGSDILTNGMYVGLKKVPNTDAAWSTVPFEAQYLKLYDVTAPSATPSAPVGPNVYAYEIGGTVQFSWSAVAPDSEGIVPTYQINRSVNGGPVTTFFTGNTNYTYSGAIGDTVSISVQAVNPDFTSNAGPVSTSSSIQLLSSTGDQDGDNMTNQAEKDAGTNPLSASSVLRITNIASTAPDSQTITWDSVSGKKYQVEAATDLTVAPAFTAISSEITASGASTSYEDTSATGTRKFYRVRLVP